MNTRTVPASNARQRHRQIGVSRIHVACQGIVPIFEAGLEEMVQRNFRAGRLRFTTNAEEGVAHGEVEAVLAQERQDAVGGLIRDVSVPSTTDHQGRTLRSCG